MSETNVMELSPDEQAVILMMRTEDKAGQAIFNYAMRYGNEPPEEGAHIPWRRSYG